MPSPRLWCAEPGVDEPRRRVIRIATLGMAAPLALVGAHAHGKPTLGDRLVEDDAEGAPKPLRPADVKPGKPLLAWPLDAATGAARNDSRLHKLVLMRFADADLDAASKTRAAGGVLAFSAVCTHQACDVKTWLAGEKALVCFCHASKFVLLDGGRVAGGPAPRALPSLPLALEGDQLVIAGPFSAPPGGTAA